jgi:hypothetical protein
VYHQEAISRAGNSPAFGDCLRLRYVPVAYPCIDFSVELSDKFREAPISNLPTPRLEGQPGPMSAVDTVNMKRAITFVRAHFTATSPEVLAGPEMATICVQFVFCFHDVNITSTPA